MLTWFDSADKVLALAKNAAVSAEVEEIYQGPFAVLPEIPENDKCDPALAAARIFKVTLGDQQFVTVVAASLQAGEVRYTAYCSDTQVQGSNRLAGKQLANNLRASGGLDNSLVNALEATGWSGLCPECAGCNFFKRFERTGNGCTHLQQVLTKVSQEEIEQLGDDVKAWHTGTPVANIASGTYDSAEEAAFYDSAFIQHVLLAGERGSGKTFLARQAADKYNAVYLEIQMHPSMEAWELRAHDRAWNGKVYTVLGKLAEAVYWIQKGKRVVLCMDEFLNMNPMYTTAVNSPLSLTANDTYLIETGRIVDAGGGIGTVETVEVPSDMLWVVATTNIGARYNLDKIPPSVRARFQIILMNTNADRTETILEKNLSRYDLPLSLAKRFKDFIETIHLFVANNDLDEEATTRLACNVIRTVSKRAARDNRPLKTEAQALKVVRKQLEAEIAQVVNFDNGPLDPEQADTYRTAVARHFG